MAISDKLTYLNTTKGKIKDSINLTGANIGSNDTFRSYAVKLRDGLLDIINNGTATLYNNFPKVSGTGSNISLLNTLEAPMFMNKFDGNTLQDGTPTSSTPIEIQSVTGLQKVTISGGTGTTPQEYDINLGKNLLPITNQDFTISDVNFKGQNGKILVDGTSSQTIYGGSFINSNMFPILLKAGTYTISRQNVGSLTLGLIDNNGNTYGQLSASSTNLYTTFTLNNQIQCYLYFYVVANKNINNELFEIQIEKGSTSTSYSPYFTPIKLYNGDYITGTPDNWSIKHVMGEVVLDGTQTIAITNWRASETSVGWVYAYNVFNNAYVPASNVGNIISNKLIASKFDDLFQKNKDNGIAVYTNTDYSVAVRTSDTTLTTASLINNYLSNNPIKTVYELATPTTEAITDTYLISQLNALYNAKSYNGQTNITVSGQLPIILEVSALKDEI